jgi:hypothetical protein
MMSSFFTSSNGGVNGVLWSSSCGRLEGTFHSIPFRASKSASSGSLSSITRHLAYTSFLIHHLMIGPFTYLDGEEDALTYR